MEASAVSRACEGKSIPGINLSHGLSSHWDSHFSALPFAVPLLLIEAAYPSVAPEELDDGWVTLFVVGHALSAVCRF